MIKDLTNVNFKIGKDKQNKYIVIHYTGALGSASNNAKYFKSINRNASAHYFVDECNIVQVVEDYDIAWHCGTSGKYKHIDCRNGNSIGIEICCEEGINGGYVMQKDAIKLAKQLTKMLADKYSIPKENILRHYDVTGKACPVEWAKDNCKEREEFVDSW